MSDDNPDKKDEADEHHHEMAPASADTIARRQLLGK